MYGFELEVCGVMIPKQRPVHFGICVFMAVLFLYSIAVQYNDPDALLWMLIYSVGLVLTILHLYEKASPALLLVASLLGICGVTYLTLSIQDVELDNLFSSWNMRGRGVVQVGEAIGLLIQSLWLAYLAVANRKTPGASVY